MRLVVVDDHALIREGVAGLLRRAWGDAELVLAASCEQAMDAAAEGEEPDLVLLDLQLPGLSGLEALRAWRTHHAAVPVVVLSADRSPAMVRAALAAGAAGFVPKSTSNEVLVAAVRLVLDGGRYLPPELLDAGPGAVAAPQALAVEATPAADARDPTADLGLSPRQLDVLRCVARGASNKVICRELGLAERTVKAHLSAVFRALNVSSRTQAAIVASRLQLPAAGGADARKG